MQYHRIITKRRIVIAEYHAEQHMLIRLGSGTCQTLINGKVVAVNDNYVVVIPKFTYVSSCEINKIDNEPIEIEILFIDDETMMSTLQAVNTNYTQKTSPWSSIGIYATEAIRANFLLLNASLSCQTNTATEYTLLKQCFFFISMSLLDAGVNILELYRFSSNESKKTTIERFIRQHPQRQWRIVDAAQILSISTSSLYRYLQQEGVSFNGILLTVRMEIALQYLTFTQYDVSQISSRLGFSNTAYFCYLFKQRYGTTAITYRKMTKNSNNNALENK